MLPSGFGLTGGLGGSVGSALSSNYACHAAKWTQSRPNSGERSQTLRALEGIAMRTSLTRTDDQFDFLGLSFQPQQRDRETCRLPPAPQLPPVTGLPHIGQRLTGSAEAPSSWNVIRSPMFPRPRDERSAWKRFLIAGAISAVLAGYVAYRGPDREREIALQSPPSPASAFQISEDTQPAGPNGDIVEGRAQPAAPTGLLQPIAGAEIEPAEADGKLLQPSQTNGTLDKTSATSTPTIVPQASTNSSDALFDTQKINPKVGRRLVTGSQVSTCYPSALAVRQEHPQAWPSYTLR